MDGLGNVKYIWSSIGIDVGSDLRTWRGRMGEVTMEDKQTGKCGSWVSQESVWSQSEKLCAKRCLRQD